MASTLVSAFANNVEEIRLRDRLSGRQLLAPNGLLYSSGCDEEAAEKFIAVDLVFQRERQIDEVEFERHRSVRPLRAEHMNTLSQRTLQTGQILAFEQRPWTTDRVLVQYDRANDRRRILLDESEVAEAFGVDFLIDFIDDHRLVVLHSDRIIVGRLNGKKFDILNTKTINTSGMEIQQICWKNHTIHLIWNTPHDSGSAISTVPISRPKSLLMAAHNSALSSKEQFLLPPYGLLEPKFGTNPYRLPQN